jgi:hypothetical protein
MSPQRAGAPGVGAPVDYWEEVRAIVCRRRKFGRPQTGSR